MYILYSRLSTTVSTTEKPKQEVTAMPLPVSTSTQQSSQSQSTPDPYLTHFDPRSEHQSYKQAQMRLEEVHKEKVTKVSRCCYHLAFAFHSFIFPWINQTILLSFPSFFFFFIFILVHSVIHFCFHSIFLVFASSLLLNHEWCKFIEWGNKQFRETAITEDREK